MGQLQYTRQSGTSGKNHKINSCVYIGMCTVSLYTINEGENKMKKNDKFAVACAFEILHECISIDHIEDCNEICKSLESYDELSKECLKNNDLSDEFLKDVQRYIDNYILPILEEDYWDFIKRKNMEKSMTKVFRNKF